ncbi:hypothetical protein V9T40_006255 [Parthenolecanium corni]|uniref:Ankyrin repeat domain-containing protein n=1 Tax=Parthenolecanium corni TaxID=536013 RepID=A0AAN9U2Z6_9HEMI
MNEVMRDEEVQNQITLPSPFQKEIPAAPDTNDEYYVCKEMNERWNQVADIGDSEFTDRYKRAEYSDCADKIGDEINKRMEQELWNQAEEEANAEPSADEYEPRILNTENSEEVSWSKAEKMVKNDIEFVTMSTSSITFQQLTDWFRFDKTIGRFKAKYYQVCGMKVKHRKRSEHLSEKQKQHNKNEKISTQSAIWEIVKNKKAAEKDKAAAKKSNNTDDLEADNSEADNSEADDLEADDSETDDSETDDSECTSSKPRTLNSFVGHAHPTPAYKKCFPAYAPVLGWCAQI